MTTRENVTIHEDMYDFIRDGVEYSVYVEAECELSVTYEPEETDCPAYSDVYCEEVEITDIHVYLEELGTVENGWDCEVKGFEMTEQELKALKEYLAERAENETNVYDCF